MMSTKKKYLSFGSVQGGTHLAGDIIVEPHCRFPFSADSLYIIIVKISNNLNIKQLVRINTR